MEIPSIIALLPLTFIMMISFSIASNSKGGCAGVILAGILGFSYVFFKLSGGDVVQAGIEIPSPLFSNLTIPGFCIGAFIGFFSTNIIRYLERIPKDLVRFVTFFIVLLSIVVGYHSLFEPLSYFFLASMPAFLIGLLSKTFLLPTKG
jgi:hypothetical protein